MYEKENMSNSSNNISKKQFIAWKAERMLMKSLLWRKRSNKKAEHFLQLKDLLRYGKKVNINFYQFNEIVIPAKQL